MSNYQDFNGPPQYQPSAPPSSTLATVSLIAGILGLTIVPFLGSVVAVITGPMAKKEIAQSRGTLGGENLARIGMILGWIGVSLGVLGCCIMAVSILLPMAIAFFGIAASEINISLPILLMF